MRYLAATRHAFRTLVRDPGTTLVAGFALTLGIGLTTMMFSVVYGAFYRGLPFEEPEEILRIRAANPSQGIPASRVRIHDYVELRAQQRAFEDLAAYSSRSVNLAGTEQAVRVNAAYMTASAFRVLATAPALGRTFLPRETERDAPWVALLGHALWRDRYRSDPDIVGRVIRVEGQPTTVVGVMPEGFRFPVEEDLWLPMAIDPTAYPRGRGSVLDVFGRLRDGISRERALTDLADILQRLALDYPESNEGVIPILEPFQDANMGDEKTAGLTMLGAVILVLLIACANVANLVLARAIARSREVGVRTALGARRSWIVGHFLAETLALSVVGAVLGLGVAVAGVRWVNATIADKGPPFWIDIRIDAVALLFVLLAVFVSTLLSGVLPAWQASRANVVELLKEQSRGAAAFRLGRLSRGLVVLEMALSCGLLVAAGLATRSVLRLNTIRADYEREGLFVARLSLPREKYGEGPGRDAFRDELLPRLRALPGVLDASFASALPGSWAGYDRVAREGDVYGRLEDRPWTRHVAVTPGFFEAFGVAAAEGRLIGPRDRDGSLPVAIVNESFARRHFPDHGAVGRRIQVGQAADAPWRTVVGIVPDMHAGGLSGTFQDAVYLPFDQDPLYMSFDMVLRTAGPPAALTRPVRDAVAAIDGDVAPYLAGSFEARLDRQYWQYSLFSTLFGSFGLAALLLGTIGLYAVMAFTTRSRISEIGIRMALGADARRVLALVLRQGASQLGAGLVLGLGLAAALAHLLASFLFGVEPRDPATFAGVVALLTVVGLGAILVPARRATAVDPVEALRAE